MLRGADYRLHGTSKEFLMRFKLLKLHLSVCLVYVRVQAPASMHQKKSVEVGEQLWKSFLSFYHVSPGD